MDISVDSNAMNSSYARMISEKNVSDKLGAKLTNKSASDEELMEACKGFEAYLLEQVMKGMEKTIPDKEEESPYLEQFGGILYQEYANNASENQSLGIAQMLYDSMKRS